MMLAASPSDLNAYSMFSLVAGFGRAMNVITSLDPVSSWQYDTLCMLKSPIVSPEGLCAAMSAARGRRCHAITRSIDK